MTEIIIEVNHLLGMLAIVAPITVITIRYFIKKEKCFTSMKAKINQLTKADGDSSETHVDFDYRLDQIEKRQLKNEIYLKLLLDNAKIKYD